MVKINVLAIMAAVAGVQAFAHQLAANDLVARGVEVFDAAVKAHLARENVATCVGPTVTVTVTSCGGGAPPVATSGPGVPPPPATSGENPPPAVSSPTYSHPSGGVPVTTVTTVTTATTSTIGVPPVIGTSVSTVESIVSSPGLTTDTVSSPTPLTTTVHPSSSIPTHSSAEPPAPTAAAVRALGSGGMLPFAVVGVVAYGLLAVY